MRFNSARYFRTLTSCSFLASDLNWLDRGRLMDAVTILSLLEAWLLSCSTRRPISRSRWNVTMWSKPWLCAETKLSGVSLSSGQFSRVKTNNCSTDSWCHVVTQIWVNIGSGNGLLPDGTKPLPALQLTDHQYLLKITWGQFQKNF